MSEIKIIICYEEVHKSKALDVTDNYVVVFLFLFDDLIKKKYYLLVYKEHPEIISNRHSLRCIHTLFFLLPFLSWFNFFKFIMLQKKILKNECFINTKKPPSRRINFN